MLTPDVIPLGSGSEIVPSVESNALAIPVEVVPQIYIEAVARGLERAKVLVVNSLETYQEAAILANNLKKFDSTIKAHILTLGRPFRDRSDKITEEGNKFRAPLDPAYKLTTEKMLTWKKADDARIAAAVEEQRKAQLAAEQERQRQESEKQRLELEAKAREEMAAKKIENATTSKQLENAIAAGEEAQALREKAEAMPVSSVPFVAQQVEIPRAVVAKGVKLTRKAVLHKVEKHKLSEIYLEVNETLLKKHILDGVITAATPGVVFTIEEGIAGTGR